MNICALWIAFGKENNFWWTPTRDICKSLEQGHCLLACVKLLGVILFLHMLVMARNQHGRHGRWMKKLQKFFVTYYCCRHNITVGNGYIRTDCCLYVQLVKHKLQDG